MLSRQDAITIAEQEVARMPPLPECDSWIVFLESTIERRFGWVFFYGSRLYSETGDLRYAVAGNAPFIVDRHTGAIVPTGTAEPVERYIAEYEARHANNGA